VDLEVPIKQLGVYNIKINLYGSVSANSRYGLLRKKIKPGILMSRCYAGPF
jgi:hypothetical protein